jgi:DNA repair protein RecO (recombination protein O)
MFVHYRSQGFIFKKENRGENDQLFAVYTKKFGKLEILGKAIRKISSKLRSGADIFYLSDIEFIQGKTHKTLTDAILIEKFENIRKDFKKLKAALKIAEVFDKLVKGQERDEKLWNLLDEILGKLNNLHSTIYNLQLLYYYFLWNFLAILGYQPDLYKCSICQKKLVAENLYFNPREGGIICSSCFKKNKQGKEIKQETIKIIRIFLKKDWQTFKKIKINSDDLKALKIISDYFLIFIKKETTGNIQ